MRWLYKSAIWLTAIVAVVGISGCSTSGGIKFVNAGASSYDKNYVTCNSALNTHRTDWDNPPQYAEYISIAISNNLTIEKCQSILHVDFQQNETKLAAHVSQAPTDSVHPTPIPTAVQTPPNEIRGKRVALVIGMSHYLYVSPLRNAQNDADLVADALLRAGFTLIGGMAQMNLNKQGFERAVRSFGDQSAGAAVALFYYAGHGMEYSGTNWLAPVTANPQKPSDLNYEMVDASTILQQFETAGTKLNIMILDACRNNQFPGRALRASNGGLATMHAPEGTLISYATQPGQVAEDGSGRDSPFTTALVQTLQKPGLNILDFFNEVGLQVKRTTGNRQQPWINSSPIEGQFYFAN